MNRIHILPEQVYTRIAAGEVVVNPAAVVKELVENAIDANATAVTIEIAQGGKELIRVTDNGSGIHAEDLPLAIQKHATSKIAVMEDLTNIASLGFRGEALASMAAVSQMRIASRTQDSLEGATLCVDGEHPPQIEAAGLPEGTTVRIENLFYNIPARRKFLKNTAKETANVSGVVSRLILAHPEIAVKYINNGNIVYQSPGSGKSLDAMMTVFGHEIRSRVLPVSLQAHELRIHGYLVTPSFLRKSAGHICFVLNGRNIASKAMQSALMDGYGERLLRGHFPLAVIYLELPASQTDVNVHPNKLQVMLYEEPAILGNLQKAVKEALSAQEAPPTLSLSNVTPHKEASSLPAALPQAEQVQQPERASQTAVQKHETEDASEADLEQVARTFAQNRIELQPRQKAAQAAAVMEDWSQSDARPASTPQAAKRTTQADEKLYQPQQNTIPREPGSLTEEGGADIIAQSERAFGKVLDQILRPDDAQQTMIEDVRSLAQYRVIGQCWNAFLIVESGDMLYFVDQHAAQERTNFERLKELAHRGGIPAQSVLIPHVEQLSGEDFLLLQQNQDLIASLGFEMEEFGPLCMKFSAFPAQVEQAGFHELVDGLLYELKHDSKEVLPLRERLIRRACKSSIKAGDALAPQELEEIMQQILHQDAIPTCPHGRPIAIAITKTEIQKGFKRKL